MTAAYRSLRFAAVTGIRINSHGKQNFSNWAIYFGACRTIAEIRRFFLCFPNFSCRKRYTSHRIPGIHHASRPGAELAVVH